METSRTIDSQASRLTRYTQRIQHIMGRSKSKSKSPFRLNHTKINKEGPKITNLDSHIKYQHSFFVLSKIIGLKTKQLMSTFFISLKLMSTNDLTSNPSSQLMKVEKLEQKPRSNIILFRLRSLVKRIMKQSFETIKINNFQIKNIGDQVTRDRNKIDSLDKAKRQFANAMFRSIHQIVKQKYQSSMTKIIRFVQTKKKNGYRVYDILQKLLISKKQSIFQVLNQNMRLNKAFSIKIKNLFLKYHIHIKNKIVQVFQKLSIQSNHQARQNQLQAITTNACLSMLTSTLNTIFNIRIMKAFSKIASLQSDNNQDENIYLKVHQDQYQNQLNASPRQKRFPRECYKFKRLLQIFYTNKMKLYDEVFYVLYQNKSSFDYLFKGSSILLKLVLRKGFQRIKQQSNEVMKFKRRQIQLDNLVRLVKIKIKQNLITGFWSIMAYSAATINYANPINNSNKCSHRLAYTLIKLYKRRIVESLIVLKCVDDQYSRINTKTQQKDNSQIIIYDDIATFLQERQQAFNNLKNGYDKLKSMVGSNHNPQIVSTSYESIRAINQIKTRLSNKFSQ